MASSDIHRKLTAILCADVVGYSRLMGENEPATLRTLTDYRQIFSEYIDKFRGRIVNAPGDSIPAFKTSLWGVRPHGILVICTQRGEEFPPVMWRKVGARESDFEALP